MTLPTWRLLSLSLLFAIGCGPAASPPATADRQESRADREESATAQAVAGHSHDGWWCDEHGVPEEDCGQCDSKVAAAFQKKDDWCQEHDRPDSQCFKCHPELEEKFAARYEAKYGRQPPKPEG